MGTIKPDSLTGVDEGEGGSADASELVAGNSVGEDIGVDINVDWEVPHAVWRKINNPMVDTWINRLRLTISGSSLEL